MEGRDRSPPARSVESFILADLLTAVEGRT